MNSTEIFEALQFIADEPSTNAKITYLSEFLDNEDFRLVVQMAYDPFITFGIKNLELSNLKVGKRTFGNFTYVILGKLKGRDLTGNAARESVWLELNGMNEESIELFKRIVDGNLKAGFDVKSVNKARKGTLPEICYMRCSLPSHVDLDNWDWKHGIVSQMKADGLFVNISNPLNGDVTIHTRKGQPFDCSAFPELTKAFKEFMACGEQYHGELLVLRDGKFLSRKDGNGVLNSIRLGGDWRPSDKPHVVIWDVISLTALLAKKCNVKYIDRLHLIDRYDVLSGENNIVGQHISKIESRIVFSIEEAKQHYVEMRKIGLEGTVIKKKSAIWKDGTSKEQVKFKDEKPCDLRILAMNVGSGKNLKTFGSLLCTTECGELQVSVSGFTDEQRQDIYDNFERHWNQALIHVKYNELTQNSKGEYSLFLPRFDGEAFDKTEADSLARIIEENL